MRKKVLVFAGIIAGLIIASLVYINLNYLYNPLTYPEGNIAERDDYSFATFKKPLVMQVVKWDTGGNESLYHYVTDEKELKHLLEQYDNAPKLEGYDSEKYFAKIPFGERGAEYTIIFRQVETWDENNIAHGRILVTFTFFENNDVFEIDGVHFYQLKNSFKKDIFKALSDKEKWITD